MIMGSRWKTRIDGTPKQVGKRYQVRREQQKLRGITPTRRTRTRHPGTISRRQVLDAHLRKSLRGLPANFQGRQTWAIRMWQWGHKGSVDMPRRAKRVATVKDLEKQMDTSDAWRHMLRWEVNPQQRTIDVYPLDYPRHDIDAFKAKTGRKVYLGSADKRTMQELRANTGFIFLENFTGPEIKQMGGVFIDAKSPGGNAAGQCAKIEGAKGSTANMVRIKKKYIGDEWIVTHELEHAKQFGGLAPGRYSSYYLDRNKDETMTELATTARVHNFRGREFEGGYYIYVPSVRQALLNWRTGKGTRREYIDALRKAQDMDRIGMTGSMDRTLRGKALETRLKEYYPESQVGKAHFSPAEFLDRYYQVNVGKMKIVVHRRYGESVRNQSQVKRDFRKEYGPDVKVFEWMDGKRVRIL